MSTTENNNNNDEYVSLAMSYYVLYCNIEFTSSTPTTTTTVKVTPPSASKDQQPDEREEAPLPPPWIPDTWTTQEEEHVALLLQSNIPRCRTPYEAPIPTTSCTTTTATTTTTKDHGVVQVLQEHDMHRCHHDNLDDTAAAALMAATNGAKTTTLTAANGDVAKETVPTTTTTTSTAWDGFYQTHSTNFFKDRHYLAVTFPQEFGSTTTTAHDRRCLVEIGCGVGNTMLPLLETGQDDDDRDANQWTVYGMDISPVAIHLLQQDVRYQTAHAQGRALAVVHDITSSTTVPRQFYHVATVTSLLFCLSAIDPIHHATAVWNAAQTLRRRKGDNNADDTDADAAVLVFRDYGRYDAAHIQLGLQRGKLLWRRRGRGQPQQHGYPTTAAADADATQHDTTFNSTTTEGDDASHTVPTRQSTEYEYWYRKHDGTMCYYFTVEQIRYLMETVAGLETLECHYIQRIYTNRATGTNRRRIWVQGRFRVPTNK